MKLLLVTSTLNLLIALFFNNATDVEYNFLEKDQEVSLEESMARGKIIYKEFCIRCHKATGEGTGKFYPPLAGSDWLATKRTASIHAVIYGLKGAITVNGIEYKKSMGNPGLENQEVADVMNYIMNSWGNTQENIVTPEEVKAIEK